ncbi:unnamed protein product [Adineta steineri]|uniref:Uncharacterized protein n=1 Tax=Adineta steineri TaxID=433720 RepID=A0A813QE88_9BILA|nr:unnamed protein product [Adineta steineri]CAF0816248.1 unnamed protein product [Adineta steineri]CAF0825737.1 unnamed protein product [Adineta steineri]CAF1024064.1 unnamed protein product [Adineta steineri]CAF1044333.1 unnamed protein product [Adineta steineri]
MVAPLLGILFISLALINLSSNINPYLHLFLRDHLKQIQENLPIAYLRESSINQFQTIFSIYVLICGLIIFIGEGLIRLLFIIPLSIILIYIIQFTIIYGITLANLPVYMFLFVCIMIILFNDCAEFDELEVK